MLSRVSVFLTFSLISLICQTTPSIASHARLFRERHQQLAREVDLSELQQGAKACGDEVHEVTKRQGANVEVPLAELQLLQTEITAFGQRLSAVLATPQDSASADPINVLQQEITAYEGRIQALLDQAGVTSAGTTESCAPFIPISLPTSILVAGAEFLQRAAKPYISKTPTPRSTISTSSTSSTKPGKTPVTVVVNVPITTSTPTRTSTSQVVATTESSKTPSPRPSRSYGYRFNPDAPDNVAVYYGQTGATGQTNLTSLCEDPSVDIVILAFLTQYFGPGGYPTVNYGAACDGQSREQQQAGASGLLSCGILASQVSTCQSIGKKVFLSLGGAIATSSFSSDQQATQFAVQLWNLFGGGNGYSPGMRPLGSIKLDGFDIDNEDHRTASYTPFATSLRAHFAADPTKSYYLSAAPQCARPDASIPLAAMQQADVVWVQFFNNANCNIGQPGFAASFSAWSADLAAAGGRPRLFIGVPAWSGGGTGYLPPGQMAAVIRLAVGVGRGNFGGVMLGDGAEAWVNGRYQQGVKRALQGR